MGADLIRVIDNFVSDPERIRQSALRAGFGTWRPNKGDIGAAFYDGVSFWGEHSHLFRALHEHFGQIIPSSMFFRITNPSMEPALIHSDREYGDYTAVVYLSEGNGSGTGFYRHKRTGMTEAPTLNEFLARDDFEGLRADMLNGSDHDWDMYEFVEGKFNRALVFDAPLIHCRLPKKGFGLTDSDSRMVWVAHYSVPE